MNKYHNRDTAPSKQSGGGGGSNKAQGKSPNIGIPTKTADWPGLPGKTQGKSRAGGMQTRGKRGEFYVKKIGI